MTLHSDRKSFRDKLDRLIRTIREEIVTGRLKAGDFLPSEKAYAKHFGLSNISVRRGLDILVSERLIEKIPRVGNKVIYSAGNDEAVIRFGYYVSLKEQAVLPFLIEQFQQRHPRIKVELVPMPQAHTFAAIKPLLDSEKSLDLFTITAPGLTDFVDKDGIEHLETMTPEPHIYRFLNGAMSSNGELKAQPFVFSPLVLCYNKDHFRSMNMLEPDSSWSWSDLFENASKFTAQNERIGFYFHFPSINRWPVFLLQSGMNFRRDPDGTLKLRSTPLADSLRICQELIRAQNQFPLLLSESEADAEKLFFTGKVSMIMTTYFSLSSYPDRSQVKFDLTPLPYVNDNKTLLLVIGLAIHAKSKSKQAAKLLLDFLTSYSSQLAIRQNTLTIPSLKTAAEWAGKEMMYRPPRFYLYREIVPTFSLHSAMHLSRDDFYIFQREARLYWSGLETMDSLLERLEKLLHKPSSERARN